eukprot:2348823-Rhodomonas_salina.1
MAAPAAAGASTPLKLRSSRCKRDAARRSKHATPASWRSLAEAESAGSTVRAVSSTECVGTYAMWRRDVWDAGMGDGAGGCLIFVPVEVLVPA